MAEEVLRYSRDCRERHHSEMVWNIEVHQRLLEKIFRARHPPHLVDFLSCHAATITKEHLSITTRPKLVDFYIHVNPRV
ncbi:hypothetical protein B0J13DRAFT_623258 [Dactylonectria estremocensis]|uniref:PD-(D/E)XK nuclease-like domain-containing protein n=1 Tax=Dactylonectria estremocensis TaxID=1079267 RepID=A0A9P9ER00_9HYPO|nr:hypothetical protein B0J13DRAFT_623258 [Dactylonectria estremocensis]